MSKTKHFYCLRQFWGVEVHGTGLRLLHGECARSLDRLLLLTFQGDMLQTKTKQQRVDVLAVTIAHA